MALRNIARMTTTTTGTGTITLGSAVGGYISFADAGVQDGEVVTYTARTPDGLNREIGRGVYTASGTTLTRQPIASTNSNNAINLTGVSEVFLTAAAEDLAPAQNVLINSDFLINQRAFAGGALTAGDYGHDRWKAATGGANYSVSGATVTLASGELEQVVETARWGHASFASLQVSVSVEEPSEDLTVTFGSQTGTISAGDGRRSVTLSLAAGDTGNLSFKIKRSVAGSVTFARPKVEIAPVATPWAPRDAVAELGLCYRYYERLSGGAGDRRLRRGYGTETGAHYYDVQFQTAKRVLPTIAILNIVYSNASSMLAFNASYYDFEAQVTIDALGGYVWFGYEADAEL